RSRWSRALAWYGASVARTSSGSAESEREVWPTRSTKTTLTTFRSSRAAEGAASGAPQPAQKRASSGLSRPQAAQTVILASVNPSAQAVEDVTTFFERGA